MWLCFNNAFLSIVSNPDDASSLIVRARRKGDIEEIFGTTVDVLTLSRRDYSFRAFIPRAVVADVVAESLLNINYGNFKNSVADCHLHDAYATVWGVMAELQERRPYSDRPRAGFKKHPVRKQHIQTLHDILGDNLSSTDVRNDE